MPTEVIRHGRIRWTNITRATRDDVEALQAEYTRFHPLDLEDLLSRIERPKIDEYDDYLFTVMHFPLWDSVEKLSRASEVDTFIGSTFVVTIHDGVLAPLVNLFERCRDNEDEREAFMGQGPGHLFHSVVDQLVDYIFPILYKVDANIRGLEEEIFTRNFRDVIQNLALIRRDNIALRRIVRPQLEILEILEKTEHHVIRDELDVYFGDIRDHLHKATDLISDHKEVIEGLVDTTNTLAAHRTNQIVQILTVISVIMLPLTLISGIYGMNIELPLHNDPRAFVVIIVMMIAVASVMLLVFKERNWL
jgi:magnesium transporter